MKLASYALASSCVLGACIAHAALTRHQFYPAAIYLTSSKLNILVLGNFAFMLSLLLARFLQFVFLGKVKDFEVENLVENGKYAVTETCLALTTFREEISYEVVFLFCTLLFFKCFHWMLIFRIDHSARIQGLPRIEHLRLIGLIMFLFSFDLLLVSQTVAGVLASPGPTVLLLFAFEFSIMIVSVASHALKYLLLVIDSRTDGRWAGKAFFMFYVEICGDLVRLFLYTSFFVIVCSYFGLPLHLVRELYITFYTLKERLNKFLRYRRLAKALEERFPDASPEQLGSSEQCIICREEMTSAKCLPCGHIFHFHCLRTWLERSSTCPTCRAAIPEQVPPIRAAPAPAAPAGAAAPAIPPGAASVSPASPATPNGQQIQQPPAHLPFLPPPPPPLPPGMPNFMPPMIPPPPERLVQSAAQHPVSSPTHGLSMAIPPPPPFANFPNVPLVFDHNERIVLGADDVTQHSMLLSRHRHWIETDIQHHKDRIDALQRMLCNIKEIEDATRQLINRNRPNSLTNDE